jgi:hypothetical protein
MRQEISLSFGNAVGENCERMTTWRAGQRERHGFAVESGDRTGMA